MKPQIICQSLCLLLVFFSNALLAKNELSSNDFQTFLNDYQQNFSALSQHPEILSQANSEQLKRINTIRNTSAYSYMHPVQIKGFELEDLTGTDLNTLSLAAFYNNQLIPIPFQFDEFDETGLIYIEGISENKIDGKAGKLNATDELLFMYRDSSPEKLNKSNYKHNNKTVLKEIEITFPNEASRYVYLLKNSNERSNADYVRPKLTDKEGSFESNYIKIRFNRNNMSLIEEISLKSSKNPTENIFDSLYFRLSAGFLNQRARINLDSRHNIKAKALGFKDGPIRTIFLVEAKAKLAGIPAVTANFNLSFYEQAAKLKSRFGVDKSKLEFFQFASYLAPLLRRPELYVEMDFVNTQGAHFGFESLGLTTTVVIDGKMSAQEKQLNDLGLPGNWIWLNSNKNWQMMLSNFLPLAEDGLAQHLLEGNRFYLNYQDNQNPKTKRENFPGASPRIVIAGEGFPKVLIELFRAFDMDILNEFDFSRQITVGETNRIIKKIHEQGKLDKIDNIIRKQLLSLKKQGIITSNEDLINAILADMNQIGIAGMSKDQTKFLVTHAMSAIKSFETFRVLDIGIAFGEAIETLNLDPDNIHYQAKDSTLWWPVDVGDPDTFYQTLNTSAKVSIVNILNAND